MTTATRRATPTTTSTTTTAPTAVAVPEALSALAAGCTLFEGPAGPVDAATHAGLRAAIGLIERDGWACPAGRAVLSALAGRCASWAGRRAAASHLVPEAVDPGEVLSLGWLMLARVGSRVAAAEAPWAYLWTSVHNAMAVEIAAGEVLSRKAVQRPAPQWPHTARRIGLGFYGEPGPDGEDDHAALTCREQRARRELTALAEAAAGHEAPPETSPALTALIGHLAGGREEDREFWTDVVAHAVAVMGGARRSYEEVALRADPYLTGVLGLSPAQLSALAVLLIGPRRGDRAGQCLLLALHADPRTDPGEVTGALARIGLLTTHRTAAAGMAGVPVAA